MTGASTKELMARMGHSTMRAALIYQHATRQRDQEIAAGISTQIEKARKGPAGGKKAAAGKRRRKESGTDLACEG